MSKYEFVGEDDHTFRVKHPDGSEFSIAKKHVGPGVHKRIKELKPAKKMYDGGVVEGDDKKDSDGFNSLFGIKGEKSPLQDDNKFNDFFGINKEMAPTAPVFDPAMIGGSSQIPPAPDVVMPAPIDTQTRMPQSVAPVMPELVVPQTTAPSMTMPAPSSPSVQDPMAASFAMRESGIKDIAGAQAAAAKAQAAAYDEQVKQMAAAEQHYQAEHAKLDAEHKQLTDSIAHDKVDPNRMWNNMSTGNKVLAAIGVALSGIGAGLMGRPDLANSGMSVIKSAIDKDIEAQKDELGKKQSLLSENVRRYGDLNTATQMTRMQLNAVTQAQVAKAAAQSGSAQAAGNAKMMLADLSMQANQMKSDMALKQMAKQGGEYDPAVLVPRIVPKEHQKAVFDEIQRAQNTRHMGDSILKAFDETAKDTSGLGALTSMVKTPRSAQALHQAMQPTFADLEGTVRQAAMDNTFQNITPTATDSSADLKTKRAALEDYLKSKMSAPTAKGFGIDLDKFGSTTTRGVSTPQTKTVNGIKYVRGPNGEAVPVK
jgi:hypothetical protein